MWVFLGRKLEDPLIEFIAWQNLYALSDSPHRVAQIARHVVVYHYSHFQTSLFPDSAIDDLKLQLLHSNSPRNILVWSKAGMYPDSAQWFKDQLVQVQHCCPQRLDDIVKCLSPHKK